MWRLSAKVPAVVSHEVAASSFTATPGPKGVLSGMSTPQVLEPVAGWLNALPLCAGLLFPVCRFSFSWNRILPEGGKGTPVNPAGIKFYSE